MATEPTGDPANPDAAPNPGAGDAAHIEHTAGDSQENAESVDLTNPLDGTQPSAEVLRAQEELRKYQRAMQEEYATNSKTGDGRDIQSKVEELYKNHAIRAANDIIWLAFNSTSDSVRLNALKFIYAEADKAALKEGDVFSKLLEKMKGDKKEPATPVEGSE